MDATMAAIMAAIAVYGSLFSYSSATAICLAEAAAVATVDVTTAAANLLNCVIGNSYHAIYIFSTLGSYILTT